MTKERKFKRVDAKLPIRCRIIHKKKRFPLSDVVETYTQNISQGGLLLSWPRGWKCDKCSHCLAWLFNLDCQLKEEPSQDTTQFLHPDTFLKLEIKSPASPKAINTSAKVVWIKKPQFPQEDTYNVGIAFTKPIPNI